MSDYLTKDDFLNFVKNEFRPFRKSIENELGQIREEITNINEEITNIKDLITIKKSVGENKKEITNIKNEMKYLKNNFEDYRKNKDSQIYEFYINDAVEMYYKIQNLKINMVII